MEWSFWSHPPVSSTHRAINLPENLYTDLVLIIQGVRRCGKSTLLMQIPERYKLPWTHCYFCNFEDPRLMNDLTHEILEQMITIARADISADLPCYFFLDEIQNVVGWEKWLHSKLERPNNNYYIVTGSNACLLSGELGTALTGRHITLELFPFSYVEFKTALPEKIFEDYLRLGGFPRPLRFDNPYPLLQEYFNDIILRDVLKRVNARTPDSIKQVAKMAFDSCGSELSYRRIAAVIGLSVDTVKTYLEACEQAFLLFSCPYFAFSEKKQLQKQKKYYPIDPGMRYAITGSITPDYGKSLELLVFLNLKKISEKVYYWQETHQGEVDFVTIKDNKITPYQVTWGQPQARHEKALEHFYAKFPQAQEPLFITRDNAEAFFSGEV